VSIEEALLENGEATEVELANLTGKSLSDISREIGELVKAGYIEWTESTNGLIWRLA
jgi:DNA-binding MarR family transcriptional regulator